MRAATGFLLALLLQTQVLDRGPDRPLTSNVPLSVAFVEPHLSINPVNGQHLLIAAIRVGPDQRTSCGAFMSADGGASWNEFTFAVQGCFDPWTAILADGSALVSMLGSLGTPDNNLFLYRSTDGGRTWPDTPLAFGRGHDHPMMAVRARRVYLVSAQSLANVTKENRDSVFVVSSSDGGGTFGPPSRFVPSNLIYEAETPAVLSDGTLLFLVADHHRRDARPGRLSSARQWLVRASESGRRFSELLFVSDTFETGRGWPSMAIDGEDRAFWLGISDRLGGVIVQASHDRGESWKPPVAVNPKIAGESWTADIATNKDGVVGVSWHQRTGSCYDIYFSASFDVGQTFSPPVVISTAASCPDTPANKAAYSRWRAGGDYNGLAAAPNGEFRIVWSDARSDIYSLRTTTVNVNR